VITDWGLGLEPDDTRDRVLRALIARDWAVAIAMHRQEWDEYEYRYVTRIVRVTYVGDLPAPADVVAELFGGNP
jgi:hypothetical protein